MTSMPDEGMKNPLVEAEDPLFLQMGVTAKEKELAWMKPNSKARRKLQGTKEQSTSTAPKKAGKRKNSAAQPLPPPEEEKRKAVSTV